MKTLLAFWLLTVLAAAIEPHMVEQSDPSAIIPDNESLPLEPVIACWNSLDCSMGQIEAMKMKDRLAFLQFMARWKLGPLVSVNQFRAVEGTMDFFIRKSIGGQKTWMSYVNAAVVEAIQRGAAISLDESQNTGGNPAALKWADYFDQRKAGKLMDRDTHDRAWALAEQTAVEYGIRVADSKPDIQAPTLREQRWQYSTKIYRMLMQYRRTLLWLIKTAFTFTNPSLPMASEAFMDWFTDVTDASSTGFLADVVWRLCALGLSWDGEEPIQEGQAIFELATDFWEEFQMSKHLNY
ncbi:predicted protein [Uncinocarpus reesii 1704]|uniref:Uncharacterized protein n=1 Tax=Uncinocarpus reesii (strain UAMH 1704) TaxID=336963 RepID=C4JTV7_UNCRE|nr:uncharacterized protein UREG_05896 [Uncinocarpus reesii 1704]EEP81054.1 predicted protein [Uncinocarpus reesii 1704]